MPEIRLNGKPYRITDAGFLVDRDAWTEALAAQLATGIGIDLTEQHWEIIFFMRDYYQRYNHIPNNRIFMKAVRNALGEDKGNTRYLYRLFPDGPLKTACLLGGLPKPTTCI